MLPALKNLSYRDHLKACNKSTLHYRRIRGDTIETYKILKGKYDVLVSPNMSIARTCITRGNDLRLQKTGLNMICGNIVSLTGLLIHGIVCLITLCLLTPLLYLRAD